MSESTSRSSQAAALLDAVRRGEFPSDAAVRSFGEEHPAEFFRDVVEPLADSFDAGDVRAYERLMRACFAGDPETVYVLSRVTLGSDIKITSVILDAMKRRFPRARVVFAAGRKSAELFAADPRIEHLAIEYPRSGPVSRRIAFAHELRHTLAGTNRIIVDPDSRMTQLGIFPACEAENYFRFPSREAGGDTGANLTELTRDWVETTFGISGEAYLAPVAEAAEADRPWAAVSLGVGDNESKRIGGDFERDLIARLSRRFATVWLDRGAGGAEAERVTRAAEGSRVRFFEGSFAGFASLISRSDFYAGYDSAGQHAAAAAGVPLVSFFAGAPSERFRQRWAPQGRGECRVLVPPVDLSEVF